MKERTLNIFWYDLLEEITVYLLDRLFKFYDPEADEFNSGPIRTWVEGKENGMPDGMLNLHPIYFKLIKSLDEPGYPPYDPAQDSPFESILLCLHEHDGDRFYDFSRAMNQIFAEDPYEALTILYKNAFVALLNDFAEDFLKKNSGYSHLYNTNGSVGLKFEIS